MTKQRIFKLEHDGTEYSPDDWTTETLEEAQKSFRDLVGLLYTEVDPMTYKGLITNNVYQIRPEKPTPVVMEQLITYAQETLADSRFSIRVFSDRKYIEFSVWDDVHEEYTKIWSVEAEKDGTLESYDIVNDKLIHDRSLESVKRSIRRFKAKHLPSAPPVPVSEALAKRYLYGLVNAGTGTLGLLRLFESREDLIEALPEYNFHESAGGVIMGEADRWTGQVPTFYVQPLVVRD